MPLGGALASPGFGGLDDAAREDVGVVLVVVPLFTEHRILTQVAGHDMAVVRILPPFVLTDEDVDEFVDALRSTIKRARRMPSSLTKFALGAAGIR